MTLPPEGSSARAIGSAKRPAPAPTSSHVSPDRTSAEQGVQDRIVGAGRIGPEERGDGGVEVCAVGDLAQSLDLLTVGAHPGSPRGFDRPSQVRGRVDIRVGAVDRDLADELWMRFEDGAEPAVATRFLDQAERGPADEDRVPATIVGVDGHDDRPTSLLRSLEEGLNDHRRDERLVAEGDKDGLGIRPDRGEPDLERVRQAAFRLRVHDPARVPPIDDVFQTPRVLAQDDHRLLDPRRGQGVQHVLEDRPARDGRQQLAAAEARSRTRGEHESHGPSGHIGIFPLPWSESSLATVGADHPRGLPPM